MSRRRTIDPSFLDRPVRFSFHEMFVYDSALTCSSSSKRSGLWCTAVSSQAINGDVFTPPILYTLDQVVFKNHLCLIHDRLKCFVLQCRSAWSLFAGRTKILNLPIEQDYHKSGWSGNCEQTDCAARNRAFSHLISKTVLIPSILPVYLQFNPHEVHYFTE